MDSSVVFAGFVRGEDILHLGKLLNKLETRKLERTADDLSSVERDGDARVEEARRDVRGGVFRKDDRFEVKRLVELRADRLASDVKADVGGFILFFASADVETVDVSKQLDGDVQRGAVLGGIEREFGGVGTVRIGFFFVLVLGSVSVVV